MEYFKLSADTGNMGDYIISPRNKLTKVYPAYIVNK
jgi:hypothetical protein